MKKKKNLLIYTPAFLCFAWAVSSSCLMLGSTFPFLMRPIVSTSVSLCIGLMAMSWGCIYVIWWVSVILAGVIFTEVAFFSVKKTGCLELLTKVIVRFFMVASWGSGHWWPLFDQVDRFVIWWNHWASRLFAFDVDKWKSLCCIVGCVFVRWAVCCVMLCVGYCVLYCIGICMYSTITHHYTYCTVLWVVGMYCTITHHSMYYVVTCTVVCCTVLYRTGYCATICSVLFGFR